MSRFRRVCAGALAGSLLLAAGCDGGGAPATANLTTERGAAWPGSVQSQPPPSLPRPRGSTASGRSSRDRSGQPATASPTAGGGGSAGTPAADSEPPADLLGNALRTGFGTPIDCISAQTRETLQGALSVTVGVRVMPSGRIIGSTVTGSGLSSADLSCMRARAEGIHLPGPVENAPRNVTVSVQFEVSSTPGTTTQEPGAPPERTLGAGNVRAASVLPAGGTEPERPGGFVAPSSTLPAIND